MNKNLFLWQKSVLFLNVHSHVLSLGTYNSRWGPDLENTVNAEVIRNLIHAFLPVQCSMSKKILAITFPVDCCVFGRFGVLSPGSTHFFDKSTNQRKNFFRLRLKEVSMGVESAVTGRALLSDAMTGSAERARGRGEGPKRADDGRAGHYLKPEPVAREV